MYALTEFIPAICRLWVHGAKEILQKNLKVWLCYKIENGRREIQIVNIIKTKASEWNTGTMLIAQNHVGMHLVCIKEHCEENCFKIVAVSRF